MRKHDVVFTKTNPKKRTSTTRKKETVQPTAPSLSLLLSTAVVLLLTLFFSPLSSQSDSTKISAAYGVSTPTPTPMPFEEMTIPYLRQQQYESSLHELIPVGTGDIYSSYVTSYTSEGLKINGLLTIPNGEVPEGGWPAILFLHGYIPPSQYQTLGQAYTSYVDYLARSGFVVFKIDLRGHGNSEGTPGGGYYGSDYVTDALHAYNALEKADYVNAERIGLWGHSMAGNMILRSLAVRPDIPASVIWGGAVFSYVDHMKYGITDTSYQPTPSIATAQSKRWEMFDTHGAPNADSLFWRQVAPTSYLDDLKGAIEIHHAVDDDVVSIGYSRDLAAFLAEKDVPYELFEYQFGGHDISGESFFTAMERTVRFFNTHLGR